MRPPATPDRAADREHRRGECQVTTVSLAALVAVLHALPLSAAAPTGADPVRPPVVLVQGIDVVEAEPVVTKAGDLEIVSAWARATPPGQKIGGGYVTIRNTGKEAVSLVSAETPVAQRTDLHQMKFDKGYPEMLPTGGPVEIPAGGEVEFRPGGLHLMMLGMKDMLRVGKTYPLTLTFSNGQTVTVDMIVWDVGTVYGK